MLKRLLLATTLVFAAACGDDVTDAGPDSTNNVRNQQPGNNASSANNATTNNGGGNATTNNATTNNANNGGTTPHAVQPLQRWPEEDRVTHDWDTDLQAVLEDDRLQGACDRYASGQTDDETKLLCGKWMFFYETFGTVGIPTALLEFGQDWYQDYYGVGYSNFGFIADPNSPEGFPLGLAETTGMSGSLETRAFTCASCHFGQMPDGRYAVGYGNMELQYGKYIASIAAPLTLSINENSQDVHPDIRAEILPHVQAAKAAQGYNLALAGTGLQLLGAESTPQITVEQQEQFMAKPPGTMDFLTEPLVDDGVWTVSRILSLWNIPTEEMRAEIGMDHAFLSWTGGATTLDSFISGFVAIGVADPGEWGPERIEPLKAYLESLRVPPLRRELPQNAVEMGGEVFVEAGCMDCHNGPSGESLEAYGYDELGVDDAMRYIFNPNAAGELCCGFEEGDSTYVVTDGIKAPRLTGLENQRRFLHNGSVESLGQLLCLEERPVDNHFAQGSQGHEYGCDLSESERGMLVTYLLSL
jgi:hypothetical protein